MSAKSAIWKEALQEMAKDGAEAELAAMEEKLIERGELIPGKNEVVSFSSGVPRLRSSGCDSPEPFAAAHGSGLECPNCGNELDHNDTFGNLDHCLDAIGHPRDAYSHRKPVKAGDIYRCPECDEWWHTFDGDGELRYGYPC